MTQAQGSQARIAYVRESTWGTTPATPTMKALAAVVYGESLGGNIEALRSNAINAARSVQAVRGGNIDAGGSMNFEASIVALGTIYKLALGTSTTTGTGPYVHTIKRGALGSATFEKGFTDVAQYFAFTGAMVDRLSMQVGPQGLVTCGLDVKAKDVSASGTSLGSPAAVTHSPIVHHEAAFLESGSAAQVLNFSLDITNNLGETRAIGNRYRAAMAAGMGTCTGQITFMFEDLVKYNKWRNETETSLKVTYTVSGGSLEILIPRVKFFGDGLPKLANDQGVVIPFTWEAVYDSTEATDVKFTLTNSEATI